MREKARQKDQEKGRSIFKRMQRHVFNKRQSHKSRRTQINKNRNTDIQSGRKRDFCDFTLSTSVCLRALDLNKIWLHGGNKSKIEASWHNKEH